MITQGQKHTLTLNFEPTSENQWDWTATIDGATLGGSNETTGTITFGGDGKLVAVTGDTFDIDFNNGTDQIAGFKT